MERRSFFTTEMGSRLRQLRREAKLTQEDVAERMGLKGAWRRATVSRLEKAEFGNPTLYTIARCLRAVGARWCRFADLLERDEDIPIPTRAIGDSDMPDSAKQVVAEATEVQTYHYQRRLPYRKGVKPIHPERLRQAAERMRDYRLVANLMEQAVAGVLATSDVNLLDYPGYRAAGRHMLGLLWRTMKSARHRRELESEAGDTMRHRVPGNTQLEKKTPDWRKLRLDLDVVQRIQAAVSEQFHQVMMNHPELLPRVRGRRKPPSPLP